MGNYRVHYKHGDVEIQVESTEKGYVDEMLKKLFLKELVATSSSASQASKNRRRGRGIGKPATTDAADEAEPALDIPVMVDRIHDADNFADIDKHILNKSAQLPRVLLVLQFAKEAGTEYLTTGQISAVTKELGVEITAPNVSHAINKTRKYFSSRTARKRGAKVYKLNRQGLQAFGQCLSPEKE